MASIIGGITVDGKEILEVDSPPGSGLGTTSPNGSLALYDDGTNGHLYFKFALADTAWIEVAYPEGGIWLTSGNALTGAAPSSPDQVFGSTNDYDTVFQRGGIEQMRLVSNALLVGLNASLGGRLQVAAANLGDELVKQISPNGGSGAPVIMVTRQYKVQTVDSTRTILAAISVPLGSRIKVHCNIGCNQWGGVAGQNGDGASYDRTFAAKRLATGPAVVTKVQSDFTDEDASVKIFDVTFAIDATTNSNVDVLVLGDVNRNVAWSATCDIMIFTN